jgi:L-lactate dehydrogenase complex protein LldG
MDTRELVLENVRRNQLAARELPQVPEFHRQTGPLISVFEKSLKYMAGEFIESPPADFSAFLRQKFPQAKNICSAVPEYSGTSQPEDYGNWSDAAGIDVTIVRSRGTGDDLELLVVNRR